MSNVASDAGNDAPLSMDDAVRSYSTTLREEVREDEAERDEGREDQPEADEEYDGQGEPEQEEQAEDDQPEDDVVDDMRRVRLSDGTVTTVGELKKGTLLHSDYTRKTQEVAQQRREIQERQTQYQQHAQQLQQTREFVMAALQATMPQQPDPAMMNTDPIGYMQAERQFNERRNQIQSLHQQSVAYQQQQEAEATQQREERLSHAREVLLQQMPELAKPEGLQAFRNDLEKHGSHYGISLAEFGMIDDPRALLMVKHAIEWRKLQASKPNTAKKVEGRPPVQRSGKRPDAGNQAARAKKAAFDNLNRSGSLKDGVAALLASQEG